MPASPSEDVFARLAQLAQQPGPLLLVLVGPNGAGKSTFYKGHLATISLPFINAEVALLGLTPRIAPAPLTGVSAHGRGREQDAPATLPVGSGCEGHLQPVRSFREFRFCGHTGTTGLIHSTASSPAILRTHILPISACPLTMLLLGGRPGLSLSIVASLPLSAGEKLLFRTLPRCRRPRSDRVRQSAPAHTGGEIRLGRG